MSRNSVRWTAKLAAWLIVAGSAAAAAVAPSIPAFACTNLPSTVDSVNAGLSGFACGEDLPLGHVAYSLAAVNVAGINATAATLTALDGKPACNAVTAIAIVTPFTDVDGGEQTPLTAVAEGAGECVSPGVPGTSGIVTTTIWYGSSANYLSGGGSSGASRSANLTVDDGVGVGTTAPFVGGPWTVYDPETQGVLWSETDITFGGNTWAAISQPVSSDGKLVCAQSSNPSIQLTCAG
jgi:hypothetical protein